MDPSPRLSVWVSGRDEGRKGRKKHGRSISGSLLERLADKLHTRESWLRISSTTAREKSHKQISNTSKVTRAETINGLSQWLKTIPPFYFSIETKVSVTRRWSFALPQNVTRPVCTPCLSFMMIVYSKTRTEYYSNAGVCVFYDSHGAGQNKPLSCPSTAALLYVSSLSSSHSFYSWNPALLPCTASLCNNHMSSQHPVPLLVFPSTVSSLFTTVTKYYIDILYTVCVPVVPAPGCVWTARCLFPSCSRGRAVSHLHHASRCLPDCLRIETQST